MSGALGEQRPGAAGLQCVDVDCTPRPQPSVPAGGCTIRTALIVHAATLREVQDEVDKLVRPEREWQVFDRGCSRHGFYAIVFLPTT